MPGAQDSGGDADARGEAEDPADALDQRVAAGAGRISTPSGANVPPFPLAAEHEETATRTSRSATNVVPWPAVETGGRMSRRPSAPTTTLKNTLNAMVTVDGGTPNAASAVVRFVKQFGC